MPEMFSLSVKLEERKGKSKILYDSVERDQFNVRFLACGKKPCDTFLKLQR